MTIRVDMPETADQFAQLIEHIQSGEEILLAQRGVLIARLTPIHARPQPRIPGQDKGSVVISPDFDAPLPAGT